MPIKEGKDTGGLMDKRVIKIKDYIKERNKKEKERFSKSIQRKIRETAFNNGTLTKEE